MSEPLEKGGRLLFSNVLSCPIVCVCLIGNSSRVVSESFVTTGPGIRSQALSILVLMRLSSFYDGVRGLEYVKSIKEAVPLLLLITTFVLDIMHNLIIYEYE